ncbi:MAG: hypothetical protein MN733_25225, partial [Nitrososphaera sp.]|nr:hypothetical protein [Nitrososphaera sp.]
MGKSYSSSELQDSVVSDILRPENLAMMFVGLGSNNEISGFGVIVDIGQSEIRIRTDVTGFNEVYLSNVRLEENGARRIMPV